MKKIRVKSHERDGSKVKAHTREINSKPASSGSKPPRLGLSLQSKEKKLDITDSPFDELKFSYLAENMNIDVITVDSRTTSNQIVHDFDLENAKYDRIKIVYNNGDSSLKNVANAYKGNRKEGISFSSYKELLDKISISYDPSSIMKFLKDNPGSWWETGSNSIGYTISDGYVESGGFGYDKLSRNKAREYITDDFRNKANSKLIQDGKIIFRLN